jgi:hypothetical protein
MRAPQVAVAVLAALVAAAAASAQQRQLPALAPGPNDALTRALADGRLTEAQYALERARSLFRLGRARREFGAVERAGGREATLVLRDLAARIGQLSEEDRARAERLLARPTDGAADPQGQGYTVDEAPPLCGAEICLHWVESSPDAPPGADGDPATVPAQVLTTQGIFEDVWAALMALGYRPPLSDEADENNGGDEKLDVYLSNIGVDGLFGYCAVDDATVLEFAVPVYCVVDDDYAELAAGTSRTPDDLLRVTAAHELFHAVQAAYDFFDDAWLLEGTATNMEETIYAEIDDNVAFLRFSPLRKPDDPLDRGGFGDSEYGAWIFWRHLEENAYDGDPTVVRRVWERAAAGLPADPDDYSLRAVVNVLRADGNHLADEFARFGVANRRRDYADRRLYPRTPTHGVFRIGPVNRTSGPHVRRLQHLATKYLTFRPRRHVSPTARLKVDVDVPVHGGRATLVVYYRDGRVRSRGLRYGPTGTGVRRVDFGRRVVSRVDLVLSNGSSRTRCWQDLDVPPFFSCFGVPRDDRRAFTFRARLRD